MGSETSLRQYDKDEKIEEVKVPSGDFSDNINDVLSGDGYVSWKNPFDICPFITQKNECKIEPISSMIRRRNKCLTQLGMQLTPVT